MGEIREARLSDTTRLQKILESSIRHSSEDYYDSKEMDALTQSYESVYRAMILTVGFNIIVSESDDKIDAFCGFDIGNSIIESLFVSPSSMGSGTGGELLHKAESQLKSVENSGVCAFSSLNATGFYNKYGYEKYGKTDIDTPDGRPVPSVLMYKEFNETDGIYDIEKKLVDLNSWN
jgi:N-acetylglutamate synthase-like GNAT family acetyltransferase